jgi:hypothetical protein
MKQVIVLLEEWRNKYDEQERMDLVRIFLPSILLVILLGAASMTVFHVNN